MLVGDLLSDMYVAQMGMGSDAQGKAGSEGYDGGVVSSMSRAYIGLGSKES